MTNNDHINFEKYRYWLGKFIPKCMQDEAIEYFLSCDVALIPYILSESNVFNWENAIYVIDKIGYPKNKTAIYSVLFALQDINWPMAQTAINIISTNYKHDKDYVIKQIELIIIKANRLNDSGWLFGLSYLVEILEIKQKDFNSNETWQILSHSEYWH